MASFQKPLLVRERRLWARVAAIPPSTIIRRSVVKRKWPRNAGNCRSLQVEAPTTPTSSLRL